MCVKKGLWGLMGHSLLCLHFLLWWHHIIHMHLPSHDLGQQLLIGMYPVFGTQEMMWREEGEGEEGEGEEGIAVTELSRTH